MSKPNFEPDQVKDVPLANETLPKREVDISDPTETSKLLLWEESCEQSLKSGATYIFSNFRLKGRGRSRYLNSPKIGGSLITTSDPYQEEVQESFSPNIFYQEDTAELVAIESFSKYNSCPKCRQKIECSDMQKILQGVFGDTMKRKISLSNWVLKISRLKQNAKTLRLTKFIV